MKVRSKIQDTRCKIVAAKNKLFRHSILFFVAHVFILLLYSSCNTAYKQLEKTTQPVLQLDSLTSVFYGYGRTVAYDTEIQFRKNTVSGLLFIKPEQNGRYRIALTAKMGMKIFDFTIDNQTFTVNQCIEQLNRKIILKQLEKDLHVLTDSYVKSERVQAFPNAADNQTVYRLKRAKDYISYFYENDTAQLLKIESGSKKKPKAIATFEDYQNDLPHHISLDHNLLVTLRLDMKWIPLKQ